MDLQTARYYQWTKVYRPYGELLTTFMPYTSISFPAGQYVGLLA
jgi:hypothetical protein